MRKKWLLGLSLAVSVFVITACSNGDDTAGDNKEEPKTQEETQGGEEGAEQAEMPKPDLEGIPEVVAEVNGGEINKEEFETTYQAQFQQMAMQSQMTGQELDQDQFKKQVVEGMISTELLIQEADNRGFKTSKEDVNKTVDELVKQNGLQSKEDLMAALKEQGIPEEEVMTQVETQVKVDQLIAEESGDTKPTEEELKEAYDQMKTGQEQMGGEEAEVPSFEEMKPNLEEQVKMQKEGEAAQKLVEELRKNADVTVNI
jgi:hypothetical protein